AQGRETAIAEIVVEPESADEIAEVVRRCERDRIPLAPLAAMRTQRLISRVAVAVSLARMNRVVAYEPDDMTVIAEAGLTLGSLNQIAAQRGQRLPADPPAPELTTLGSLIASSKTGPLRLSEGTIRDLLIGIRFVGHGGRIVHAGGRVVKNVAGYDLMKLMTGSFGTLGIITEAACKVRPIPPIYRLVVAGFAAIGMAFEAAQKAERAAALYHCEVVSRAIAGAFAERGEFILLAGFGGIPAEVEHQHNGLLASLGRDARILADAEAEAAYRWLRDLTPLGATVAAQIAVKPAELARCLEALGVAFRAHALNGVAQIWSDAGNHEDPRDLVAKWRAIAHTARGHLRVIAASSEVRRDFAMFDVPPPPATALMKRLKAAFDPHNVFNPNCFVGGGHGL
ncbi:MAG: FAD-binding oxidoreductase, partial [Stellaceae bacterium]